MLSDTVLVIHFCIVLFVISGFILVPVGYRFNWGWIRLRWLRITHGVLMTFVTLETLFGFDCPLTLLENYWRAVETTESFIGYWVRYIFYWEFPVEVFVFLYLLCLVWTGAMWKLFPPKLR